MTCDNVLVYVICFITVVVDGLVSSGTGPTRSFIHGTRPSLPVLDAGRRDSDRTERRRGRKGNGREGDRSVRLSGPPQNYISTRLETISGSCWLHEVGDDDKGRARAGREAGR